MRLCALLLPILLTLPPAIAHAQSGDALAPARLSIAPVIGFRGSLLGNGSTRVVLPGRVFPVVVDFEPERSSGVVMGADVDVRIAGRVGLAGGVLYTNADPLSITNQAESGLVTQLRIDGPSVWLARVGLSYRLPDLEAGRGGPFPAGYLVVGPAGVRQDYRDSLLEHPGEDPLDSWAMYLGYRAHFPVGSPGVVLQLSVEDYVPVWNRRGERDRIARVLELDPGTVVTSDFHFNRAHIPLVHLGLAFRL